MDAVSRVFRDSLACEGVDEVAETCLFVAEALTGSRSGFIGLVNAKGRFDTLALSDPGWQACRIPESRATILLQYMTIRGLLGLVLHEGRSLITNEPAAHPDASEMPEGHPPLTTFLGVPLKQMGETIGMIGLANKPGGYQPVDQQDLEVLAVAFGEALNRKRIEEALRRSETQLRRQAIQLALLNDAGSQIAAMTDADVLLRKTTQLVQESFGYHHVAVFTLHRGRGELEMKALAGRFVDLFPRDHRLKLGVGLVGWTGLHGRATLVNDVSNDTRYVNYYPDVVPTQSELCVAIHSGDEVVGVLDIQSADLNAFDQDDVTIMATLSDQIAVALEKARLVAGLEDDVAARTAELVAEKEKSETILRSVGEAIVVSNLERRIEYVNEAFTAMTGYAAGEAIGQPSDFVVPQRLPEADWRSLDESLARGDTWHGESIIRRKDGRTYDAALTIAPMRDAEGRTVGYVSSHSDISHAKQLEQARNQFISNVSHELRTPVTNLKLYAQMLRQGRRPERTQEFLQVLEKEADRLNNLSNDFLTMAELDSGQIIAEWRSVALRHVVAFVLARYQDQAEEAGLMLTAQPTPPDLHAVRGDQNRLTQAVGELIENAIHFTPAGGQITIETDVATRDGQPWVTLTVRDSGPGIPPDQQEHIFERLYRGSLAAAGHIPGTGLGLSIVDEIARAHGGLVTVESQVGKGSTFTLWLRPEPSA